MSTPQRIRATDEKQFLADYRELGSYVALAAKWGIGYQTARRTVARLGAVTAPRRVSSPVHEHPDLGVVPDRVIAAQLGVSEQVVSRARRKAGIPSWRARRKRKK
jgi:hypothetical protein